MARMMRTSASFHWLFRLPGTPAMWLLIICWLLSGSGSLQAQSEQVGVRAGILGGGPIPSQALNPDSSGGEMAWGPSVGAMVRWELGPRWSLQLELGYAYKGASYWQISRADTLVALELIPGMTDTVPSYYYADVSGKIALHYLEIPLLAEFKVSDRMRIKGGLHAGWLLGGSDKGEARIQIGDGALLGDTTFAFNNIDEIRPVDLGLILGGAYEFESGLVIELRGQRGLRSIYRPGFFSSQGQKENGLYHTQFYLGAGWWF